MVECIAGGVDYMDFYVGGIDRAKDEIGEIENMMFKKLCGVFLKFVK